MTAPATRPQADAPADAGPLLEVRDLRTYFKVMDGIVRAVDGISFSIGRGQTLGVVGESGCGKSVTALSIMRLHDTPPTWIPTEQNQDRIPDDVRQLLGDAPPARITFEGRDLLALPEDEMRHVRGNDIAMIFQEPMTSLNPVFTVGNQISEAVTLHQGLSKKDAWDKAVESIRAVGINNPERRVKQYPHEMSGGMRQRVMIAMALSCDPKLLIADEPTTALDVTIQAQILELIREVQDRTGAALMLITHDLGVVAETVHDVVVMYAGRVVETGPVDEVLLTPRHPYTEGLLTSIPSRGMKGQRLNVIRGTVPNPFNMPTGCNFAPRCPYVFEPCGDHDPRIEEADPPGLGGARVTAEPAAAAARPTAGDGDEVLVSVRALKKYYPIYGGLLRRKLADVKAVDGVSFQVHRGEVFGLVGESGCGKSTLGKTLIRLQPATAGSASISNEDIFQKKGDDLKRLRRRMQIIFQDPVGSLNPRMPISDIIGEGLVAQATKENQWSDRKIRDKRVEDYLQAVGLRRDYTRRYPHEFSGGQRQRIGIARALVLDPEFIVCDEPVSALDVSIQSQILNLLLDLRREFNLTYLFIAHNLSVVQYISDRVGVMYLGKLVELARVEQLYTRPRHPYTVALLSAVPDPDPRVKKKRIVLTGDVPSPAAPPSGCRFHTRCWLRERLGNPENCETDDPAFRDLGAGHRVACHWAEEIPDTVVHEAVAVDVPPPVIAAAAGGSTPVPPSMPQPGGSAAVPAEAMGPGEDPASGTPMP